MFRTSTTTQTAAPVLHVRFEGRSCDIPLSDLDVGNLSPEKQVKDSVARYLGVAPGRMVNYRIDRHETGNMTLRPEAIFG